jgi:glycosyltransferase involved in cell wall biosynthesis
MALTDAKPSVSVVIPVHNEEEILVSTTEAVLSGFRNMNDVHLSDVILSENGSRDRTRELAGRLAADHREVKVIISDLADYGAAMRRGFLAARGDCIVNFDADYYDFEFVTAALKVDADIVVAAKNIEGSADARVLVRRVGSRCFAWLVRRLLGIKTTETHGIKLYWRRAIEDILEQVRASKDLFDTELVARAELAGLRVVELPIATKELRHSRSGILRRIPRTLVGLLVLRRRLSAARRASKQGASGDSKFA